MSKQLTKILTLLLSLALLLSACGAQTESGQNGAADEQEPEGWRCVSDNEDVTEVRDIVYASESVSAYLLPGGQPGSATVKMTDPDSGTEITLICEVDANGDFRVTSHSITQ